MTDAFDTMFPRRPPMNETTAREVVAEMRTKTAKAAAIRLLQIALGPAGNLTSAAREVYRAELERLQS